MDEMIFNAIDDVVLESEFDTAYALAQGYLKAIAILESDDVTGEAEGFAIFQESGDEKDKKKSKEEKKDAAKGGLINAIKRMFAAIAAKFKKSEETNPTKVDEKKKSKLKKLGIVAGVTTAAAGAALIVKKASDNRTDAEIQDELRKMANSSEENAIKVHDALATIAIKNGGKVYFDAPPIEPIADMVKKIAKFLDNPGTDQETNKIVEEVNKLCVYDKAALRNYELGDYNRQYEKCYKVILTDIGIIVDKDPDPNSSDGSIRVLAAFNKLESKAWRRVSSTLDKVQNAIYSLNYTDDNGEKHGIGVKPTSTGKVTTAEKAAEAEEKFVQKHADRL